MSNLVKYAESELDRIGMTDDGDMNGLMRKHLLHMVKEFSEEGHSGFSASYALQCLEKLLRFKPLSPITGEDDEWWEHPYGESGVTYQNKRCSSIFKESEDGQAYDIDGRVFWEWIRDEETGEAVKSYYTNRDSRLFITFPYAVPDKPVYEYRKSSAEPSSPPQNEDGLL